jgi:hypothetical protein
MLGFLSEYRGAFQRECKIGRKQWVLFTLKSALLMIVLFLAFSCGQYALLFFTSLYEYVTVDEVRVSSLIGIALSLLISFVPSILYLFRLSLP